MANVGARSTAQSARSNSEFVWCASVLRVPRARWQCTRSPVAQSWRAGGERCLFLAALADLHVQIALGPAPSLAYRTLDQMIEVVVFEGPTVADVVKQYTSVFTPPGGLVLRNKRENMTDYSQYTHNDAIILVVRLSAFALWLSQYERNSQSARAQSQSRHSAGHTSGRHRLHAWSKRFHCRSGLK